MTELAKKLDEELQEKGKTVDGDSVTSQMLNISSSVLLKIPLTLVLLPVTVTNNLVDAILPGKKKTEGEEDGNPPGTWSSDLSVKQDRIPFADRKYDVVLYGCTGFTGKLAAKYLAKQYGTSIKWAIAGRNSKKVQAVLQELVEINGDLQDHVEIIQADSGNPESLPGLVENTRVLLSAVGPFMKYGIPVVEQCAVYGTSYADTTGEIDFVRGNISHLSSLCEESGSRIVSLCGLDCIPWEMMTLALSEELKEMDKERGEEGEAQTLEGVRMYDEFRMQASGGTIATVIHTITSRAEKKKDAFDPLLRQEDGSKSPFKLKSLTSFLPSYSSERGKWTGFFPLSLGNSDAVKRSNALNGYGDQVTYREQKVFPNFATAFSEVVDLALTGVVLSSSLLRSAAFSAGALPKPGEGASDAAMDKGFLRVVGFAKGSKGDEVVGSLMYNTDAGYRDTARMLVETGLCLSVKDVAEGGRVWDRTKGGVYTPGCSVGMDLLDRLVETGCEFNVLQRNKSTN